MLSILFITNTSLQSQWTYQFGLLPNYPSHYFINDAAGIGRNLIPPTPGVPLDINSTPKLLIHSTNDVTNNNLTKAILRIQDVKYNESNEATMYAGSPQIQFWSNQYQTSNQWIGGKIQMVTNTNNTNISQVTQNVSGGLGFFSKPKETQVLPFSENLVETMKVIDNKVAVGLRDFQPKNIFTVTPNNRETDIFAVDYFSNETTNAMLLKLYNRTGTLDANNDLNIYKWHIELPRANSVNGPWGALNFCASESIANSIEHADMTKLVTFTRDGKVGITEENPTAKLQVKNGSVLFNGDIGTNPITGAGTRMMWIPEKAAFRGGYVSNNLWDNNNIGFKSFAFGQNANAYYTHDIAMGLESFAHSKYWFNVGYDSLAYHGAIALGHSAKSRQFDAVAIGLNTLADSRFAIAIGQNSFAHNDRNIAIGQYVSSGLNRTTASSPQSALSFIFGSGINDIDAPNNFLQNPYPLSIMFGVYSKSSTMFLTGGDQRFVGIGTDNPVGALYINTSDIWYGPDPDDKIDQRGVMIGKSWVTNSSPSQNSQGVDLSIQGNVGIGNFSSENKLSITGSGDDNQVLIWSNAINVIDNYDVDLMVEKKVLIGTSTVLRDVNSQPIDAILQVNGNIYATGTIVPSDLKLKNDINKFEAGLKILKQIKPVTYKYKSEYGFDDKITHVGIIAQEVKDILPFSIKEAVYVKNNIVEEERSQIDTLFNNYKINLNGKDSLISDYKLVNTIIPAKYEQKEETILTYNPNSLIYLMLNSVKELDSLNTLNIFNSTRSIDSLKILNQNLEEKIKLLEENVEYLKKCCQNQQIDIYEDVILEQNSPNPFDQSTTIAYYIPERLYPPFEVITTNLDGTQIIDRFQVENKIPNSLTISANKYQTGVYVYSILNAGKIIKSKKMMIIK